MKSDMEKRIHNNGNHQCPQVDKRLCPEGVVHFGHCFTFVSQKMDWKSAEAHCQNLAPGSHLASIHCKKQHDIILSMIPKVKEKHMTTWIGMHDIKTEGIHVWIDDSPTDFAKWYPGEPNNEGNEDCVQIIDKKTIGWNDESCRLKYPFICSHKLSCS
ncbi:lectin-like [Scyliorhinus torazame]|uniref:lectin-like n=1 Tax=Scyliorhinus torazame TaxID=75743 RepID=UPI003B5AB9F3